MSDITERLRAIRGKLKGGEYNGADLMESWCAAQDGADQIDALRADNARLLGGYRRILDPDVATDPWKIAQEMLSPTPQTSAPRIDSDYFARAPGPNIRQVAGVSVCGWCGFAMVAAGPRQCCTQGTDWDAL